VVQTAYANGAARQFLIDQLGIEPVMAKTGVKHLHAKAQAFDVGIYYESNGHGTVLFSERILEYASLHPEAAAARDVVALSEVVNQAVGDAFSGILLVESILRRKSWGLRDWAAMYTDLASRQLKVKVADRRAITTTEDESKCLEPKELQPLIETEVARLGARRAFVRPSGTEDIVRVYAESEKQEDADALADAVSGLVLDLLGGPPPTAVGS